MAARDNLICELKPQSGDTTLHNLVGAMNTLTGTAAAGLTFGTDADGYYCEISAGTLTAAIASKAIVGATTGTGVTLAIRAKMVNYNGGGFDKLIGYSADTTIDNGVWISQNGTNLRSRYKADLATVIASPGVGTAVFTMVCRFNTVSTSAQDTQSVWLSTTGNTGTSPDITSSVENFANVTPTNINFLLAGTGKIRIYYLAIFDAEKSNADGGGMRNDILTYMAGAAPVNLVGENMSMNNTISGGAVTVTPAGGGTVNTVAANMSMNNLMSGGAVTVTPGTGTVTSDEFRNWANILQVEITVPYVAFLSMTGSGVLLLTNQVTNNAGKLVINNAALVAGVPVMMACWDPSDTNPDTMQRGFKKMVPA
jgi:hypothetical protein